MPERFLALDETFNTRDIGGYATRDGRTLRYGRFFRSDSLHNLSPAGQNALHAAGIRTVIDLRRVDEAAADPNKLDTIPDVIQFNMPILPIAASSPSAENSLRTVQSMGDVYPAIIDHFQPQMGQVMRTIADKSESGVLVHCSAGKDRTGVVIALLMELVGVPDDTIAADYMITLDRLAPIRDRLRQRALTAGLDMVRHERMFHMEPEYMYRFLNHLRQNHGSAAEYFVRIGLSNAQIDNLRLALIAE